MIDTTTRCGIDTVEVARMERLVRENPPEDLRRIFAAAEIAEHVRPTCKELVEKK